MSQVVKVGQLEIRYLVDGAQAGGLGLFEMTVPPDAQVPPPHSHSHNEECVYVLEGVLRYTVDGETRDLNPGDWMSTPRGAVHAFSNPGSVTARTLVMLTPDMGVGYFVEGCSAVLRLFQTGYVGTYALFLTLGVLALFLHFLRS